jgi:hypothetical protein
VCKLFIINDIENCRVRCFEEVGQVSGNTRLKDGRNVLYISLLVRLFGDRTDGAFNGESIARKGPYVNENIIVRVRTATSNGSFEWLPPRIDLAVGKFGPKKATAICTVRGEEAAVCPAVVDGADRVA